LRLAAMPRQDPGRVVFAYEYQTSVHLFCPSNGNVHPIISPDGKGVLTELSPSHHLHQTGVFWGFTRANGRDYFGNPGNGYWHRVSYLPLISEGAAVNSIGQCNKAADSQRALWVDVAMAIEGHDDWGHIAILEHPQNYDFPQPWRVDKNLGVGPSRAKLGGWKINKGERDTYLHQLVIYAGELSDSILNEDWLQYSGEKSLPPGSGWPGGVITSKKP